MVEDSQPHIIRLPQLPFIECRVCTRQVDIAPIDRRIGKIPDHDRPDDPKQKCPASGKSLKGIHIHNL